MLYDTTSRETFESISNWIHEIKDKADKDICIILVGNKVDLADKRKVSIEEGMKLANMNEIKFLEASAKSNTNISQTFETLGCDMLQFFGLNNLKRNESIVLNSKKRVRKESCC